MTPPWMNRTKEMDRTKPMDTATPKDEAVDKGQGTGQSPPPLGTTSALAVPEKERPLPSMGDGREGHPLILPPDIAQKYGDKDLILPDWWTSPYTAMPHDFPKGSGYGYVQSPYTSWWTRIYGVSPISDLPKYRYMYRNVPEIKAAIDKTVFLSVARGMDLKLPKDDAVQGGPAQGAGAPKLDANGKPIPPPFGKDKAPPFGQKDGEPGALGEGGAPPEENEPGQEQGQEAVTPAGEPAPGEAEVVKGKPRPFGAADLPFPEEETDTPPEEHPFLKDAPKDEVGNLPPEGEPQGQAPNPKVPGPEQDKALAVRGPGGIAIPKPKTKNQQIIEFLDDFLGSINWIDIQVQALTDMLVYGNAWVELAYDGQKALERNLKPDEAKDIENYSKPAPEGYKPGPGDKVIEIKGEGKVWDMKLLDPLFMRVRRDSLGNVYGAIQWLAWPPVVFSNDKVVHVAYNRKSWAYENAYGTSQLMSLIRVQDMIWQLESDMMAVSHINIAPALTIYGGTPTSPYTNQQMGGLIDDMDARGPASNIFLKGDCKAEALPLIAQLGGISQFFTYLKDQRIILLGVPPDLMGIEMPGSYSKSAVSIAEFKARVKALQEVWGNALHDFIFPRILRPVFGDDCPIPKCVWKSPFEEDRTQTSNRVREDYKLGLITKRVALQEAGYDCDPSDPDLDEFYKPPAPPPGLGGPEQFEDKDGNPAVPAGSGPDGEPVDKDGAPLKRKPPPPPFGGPPGQGKPPFGKVPGKGVAGQPAPSVNEDFGKPNAPYKAASNAGTLVYLSKLAENYGFQIYLVNSEFIAKNIDPRWDSALGKGHLIGGHHWALGMLYIPVDEIWISNAVPSSEREYIMLHELTEAPLMKNGMSYGDAHRRATDVEETAKSLTKSIRDFNYGIGDMSDGSFRAKEADQTEQGVPFFAYDPDQARDETGKWTTDGGGGGPAVEMEKSILFERDDKGVLWAIPKVKDRENMSKAEALDVARAYGHDRAQLTRQHPDWSTEMIDEEAKKMVGLGERESTMLIHPPEPKAPEVKPPEPKVEPKPEPPKAPEAPKVPEVKPEAPKPKAAPKEVPKSEPKTEGKDAIQGPEPKKGADVGLDGKNLGKRLAGKTSWANHAMSLDDKAKSYKVEKVTTPDGTTLDVRVAPGLMKTDPGQLTAFKRGLHDMPPGLAKAFEGRQIILHDYKDRPIETTGTTGWSKRESITGGFYNPASKTLHITSPLGNDPGILPHEVSHAESHNIQDEISKELYHKLGPQEKMKVDEYMRSVTANRNERLQRAESNKSYGMDRLKDREEEAKRYLGKYKEDLQQAQDPNNPKYRDDPEARKAAIERAEGFVKAREKMLSDRAHKTAVTLIEKKFALERKTATDNTDPTTHFQMVTMARGKLGPMPAYGVAAWPNVEEGKPPEDASELHKAYYNFYKDARTAKLGGPTTYARSNKGGMGHVDETYAEINALYGTKSHRGQTKEELERDYPELAKSYKELRDAYAKRRS